MAQTRSRLVLLASRLGEIAPPEPTHLDGYRTVRDEIGALPRLKHGEVDERDPLHRTSKLSVTNARRVASAKPGGHLERLGSRFGDSLPPNRIGPWLFLRIRPPGVERAIAYDHDTVLRFWKWRFGHPEQDRALSLREGALLQGFPRDYQFVGGAARLLNNTRPCLTK